MMETVNLTLSLPKNLHEEMKKHEEIKWSTVIKGIISKKIKDLELLNRLTKRSKLTEKDAEELSEIIKISAAKKLGVL